MSPIPWARPILFGDEKVLAAEAIDSTYLSAGVFVERLEREFGLRHGAPDAVLAVSNGTTAIELAYLGLGIGPGDEVVQPGWCFAAVANMTRAVGAQPVFAEILPDTWLIDPADIEHRITPKTRALVAVHTYGNICDMPALIEIGRRHGIPVIEDCAEAMFSHLDGRPCGTFGDVATWSLQSTKTITSGEGGLVLVRDPALRRRMKLLRSHGMVGPRKYWHEEFGRNYRLTNVQAAIAVAQLGHLDELLALRHRVDQGYQRRLGNLPGIRLQHYPAAVDPVVWAFAVLIDPAVHQVPRDRVMAHMTKRGVETRPGFYSFGQQPLYGAPPLANADLIAAQTIALPFPPDLSDGEQDRVVAALQEGLKQGP
jgi:perosamine synthetase